MKTIKQGETILSGGTRRPNYFNGRILTAEALQEEQSAQQSHLAEFGRAIGEGVIVGLGVRPAGGEPPVTSVVVASGTALTRAGTILKLTQPVTVELAPSEGAGPASTGGDFSVCATEPGGETVLSGQGLYLVTLGPAVGLEGRAPRVGLGEGEASGCGRRYVVEGVTVRLRDASGLIPAESAVRSAETPEVERNVIAHAALGSLRAEERISDLPGLFRSARTAVLDPAASFEPPGGGDALDGLRKTGYLPADEAPLALLQWTDDGISFVDIWAVRRRPHMPVRASLAQTPVDDARRAVAEAALRQFEIHVGDADLSIGEVFGSFRFLPGAGLFQLSEPQAADFAGSVYAFLRSRQQIQRIASVVEVSQDVTGEDANARTLEILERYFEELGAWSAYARALEDANSDLTGEIVSANEHAGFLEESEDEARAAAEELLGPLGDIVDPQEFIDAAMVKGESSVDLRTRLSLPWWMVDIDVSLIDGAEVGPLFDRSFWQGPLFIRQLSLQRLRERVVRGEATRADLPRRLVPSVQLHLVRDSLPAQIADIALHEVDEDAFSAGIGTIYILFSPQTGRIPLGRFPKPWPIPDPDAERDFRTVIPTIDDRSVIARRTFEEKFVSDEVRMLKENLGVSTEQAEVLFDRFGVQETRDLLKIDERDLRTTLQLNQEETRNLFRKVHRSPR